MQKNLSIIGVPFELGCDREGAGKAPEWLWRHSAFHAAQNIVVPVVQGALENDQLRFGVKNYDEVLNTCIALRDVVADAYRNAQRLVVLGGDHTIALGSIAGVLQNEPDTAVIWFDAHGDINTESTSPSANAHGMPLAALMGLCRSGLNDVAKVRLKPQNVFWIGARDLDDGEIEILKSLNIYDHVYAAETIRQHGMTFVMKELSSKMKARGIERLHLSFDIDGMDPSVVAATGTKVPDGLTQRDLQDFVAALPTLPPIQTMDFVEYNPEMDDAEYTTGKWCIEALNLLDVKS